ncbi:hypothetical protein HRG_012902 [Hirsutella rhossiliensis]
MDYDRELIEELKKIRNTEELRQRPLFFVAHSFVVCYFTRQSKLGSLSLTAKANARNGPETSRRRVPVQGVPLSVGWSWGCDLIPIPLQEACPHMSVFWVHASNAVRFR